VLDQSLGEEDMGQDASRLPRAAFKGRTMKHGQHGEREGQSWAAQADWSDCAPKSHSPQSHDSDFAHFDFERLVFLESKKGSTGSRVETIELFRQRCLSRTGQAH
jgi:hypothetical protein